MFDRVLNGSREFTVIILHKNKFQKQNESQICSNSFTSKHLFFLRYINNTIIFITHRNMQTASWKKVVKFNDENAGAKYKAT